MKIKPAVFLIRLKNNPVSMWEAGRTYECWTRQGYSVTLIDGYCPETYHESPYKLNFQIKKSHAGEREFTESEKAVFHSHLKALDIAKRKKSPSIIIEHDAHLIENPPDHILEKPLVLLGHAVREPRKILLPCLAYMINPELSGYFSDDLCIRKITLNIDGYLWNFADSYQGVEDKFKYQGCVIQNEEFREELGTTIDHGKKDHLPKSQW